MAVKLTVSKIDRCQMWDWSDHNEIDYNSLRCWSWTYTKWPASTEVCALPSASSVLHVCHITRAISIHVPCKRGSLINDGWLHPVADAGDVMMMMVMHQVLHGSGASAGGTDPGCQQCRRLLLETRVHSRLHRLVQAEHHLVRFQSRFAARPESETMTIDDASGWNSADVFASRLL